MMDEGACERHAGHALVKKGPKMQIPDKLYFKIGEVSKITKVMPYVLRYWESEFRIISPKKSLSRQRVYTKNDIELILEIKKLLYKEKFTLEGAKKRIKEFRDQKSKQLDFPFSDTKYQSALKAIKKDLSSIKKMLSD
ncbi:MAG: MerR family transcriptional regulator [Deltaproteobacteria bacterium]|nr:MerR family transcriptional regulator [Deltaproteobacteria bacterium]